MFAEYFFDAVYTLLSFATVHIVVADANSFMREYLLPCAKMVGHRVSNNTVHVEYDSGRFDADLFHCKIIRVILRSVFGVRVDIFWKVGCAV